MSNYYSETWIEGIGSSNGLLLTNIPEMVGGYNYLLCVHDMEDELIYMNPTFDECYIFIHSK